jgi:tetratricopeptide (TPR) repeat protein
MSVSSPGMESSMPNAYLLLLLVILLGFAIFLVLPAGRTSLANLSDRIRKRFMPRPTNGDVVLIDRNGDELPMPAAGAQARLRRGERLRELIRRREWRQAIQGSRRLLASLVIILIGLIALWQLPGLLPSRLNRFTVLVAPFNERDGSLSQTGSVVADQLVTLLNDSRRVRAQRVSAPPADLNAALAMMDREGADALVWGTIAPGGMLNQDSLIPALAYRPTGVFAPLGWDGYNGRFAMPEFYTLADAPINGQGVLAQLLYALADYGAGQVDGPFNTLGSLIDSTPALMPALPHALRGNILWARGEYEQAAGEYQRALNQTNRPEHTGIPDPRPLLTNNLGAILQDANDPNAEATLLQTVDLLAGRDLGALRYNFGIQFLRSGKLKEAIESLEAARGLLPPSTALPLMLSDAYRMDVDHAATAFPKAHSALDEALEQISSETQATTPEVRPLAESRLRAALAEQRALLNLTEFLQARGPLLWELQASDQLAAPALSSVRSDLAEAVRQTEALTLGWNRRSVSEDASERPIGGLVAISQFRRAQAQLRQRLIWQAAVEIETARVQGVEPPRGLAALWNRLMGNRTALGQSEQNLRLLIDTQPNDVEATVLYGEALLLTDGATAATEWFEKAAAADPRRPEPVYGQALVAEAQNNQPGAIELLTRAIGLDERYFPAHQKLAALAEAGEQWNIAVDQRRWLARNRPSFAQTLALAAALRNSGPAGYAEAERELLGLINDPALEDADKVPALTELGRLYEDSKNIAAARAVLERARRAAPRDPNVAYVLGHILVAQGDSAAGAEQFRIAITNDPQPVQARLELAAFYIKQANAALQEDLPTPTATPRANAALQPNAAIPYETQQRQRRLQRYIENINAANEQYRAAFSAGASDPRSLRQIGDRLQASGDYEGAASAYGRLVERAPKDPAAREALARAYIQLDRLDAARGAEQQALDLSGGKYPAAQAGLGEIARRQGRPDEATQQYNAALQQDPDLGAAYIGLGRVAADAGNWSVAAAHFQRGLDHDGTAAEAHYWLGEALLQQRSANSAVAEYRQAIGISPEYAEAYYGLARAQIASGQPEQIEQAKSNLMLALTIRPAYAEVWLEQGKLYEQGRNDQAAISAYSQAISAKPRLAEARYRRARLYIRQDRMSEAESDLEAATSAQPNFPEAHYWLGRVYLAENRPQVARDEFKAAVAQRSDNYPDARFYQGIAEEQLGQRTEALASFKTALAQGGDSAWANDARAALARLGPP